MIVYYMNLILTTILNSASRLLHRRKLEKSKCWEEKISFILCALAIATAVFVAGLRYGVGTDFFNYQDRFNHYLKYPNINIQRSNVGFGILIKFIQLFTDNPQWLFIATAIIIYTFIMLYIRENTKLYDIGFYLFICLYFYCSSLNIMRQWISIAIFLYALKYAYQKKLIKYIIAIVIAASFHITSLLMLPVYLLFRLKLNKRNVIILISILLALIIVFYTAGIPIAEWLNVPEKYMEYIRFNTTLDGGGRAYTVFILLTIIGIAINYKTYLKQNQYGEQHIKMLIISLIISALSANSMIFNRIQLYFVPVLIVCIPNLIQICQNKKTKVFFTALIIGLGVLYFYRCLCNNGGEVLPYISIFDVK